MIQNYFIVKMIIFIFIFLKEIVKLFPFIIKNVLYVNIIFVIFVIDIEQLLQLLKIVQFVA